MTSAIRLQPAPGLQPTPLDLSPARWIWFPSQRTLPNTFILFRREIDLREWPARVTGWVTADSRYRFTVNGRRAQWGPAPSDPRQLDVDPIDLTPYLQPGRNVIGAEVLHYSHGDGTWPAGKPGFICRLDIEYAHSPREQIVSDDTWLCCLDRAHRPGQHKRWYLRALQEQFDARLHPHGWDTPAFTPDSAWLPAMLLDAPADKPATRSSYDDYANEDFHPFPGFADKFALRARQVPLLRETLVPALRLAEAARIEWLRAPEDWFDMRVPGSFRISRQPLPLDAEAFTPERHEWRAPASAPNEGIALTFEFHEEMVGWPCFTIDAAEGTIIELLCQESHDPANGPWLDTHFYAWSRFICREGINTFETFDFESPRWVQLHIRNAARPAMVRDVAIRRRVYDWPNPARIACSEPALQRLFDATINTLRNSAQDTIVDGMGRERQQYSGDCGHQLHAVRYAFGDTDLSRRYLRTFSEGLALDGYFMDAWPAWDRLARVSQRQVDATNWGPILDHGVGFIFDNWHHYLETGDLDALREPYPRLLRFADYLKGLRDTKGLLPVENVGVPCVWIDHEAFQKQRHKQCAFNLYAAAMYQHALAPICRAFGEHERAKAFARLGQDLQSAAVRAFWSRERGAFVNNRPWLDEEGAVRMDDRSLATALLFDQCPNSNIAASLNTLADCPPEMGFSYPCNAGWRLWALARHGRIDVVLNDLRQRWATMRSVIENNTLQEFWQARPDSTDEWSHCPVAPVYVLFMDVAGIRPLAPDFARAQIRPQLDGLERLSLTAHTVRGPIEFEAEMTNTPPHGHRVTVSLPDGCEGELVLPDGLPADLPSLTPDHPLGLKRYRLAAGQRHQWRM